ncbi:MAG TPA: hypothetical protein VJ801_10065, partial [Polyangia bacterium]|nr:hypothetical protein [Polyangia bacterium]
MNKDDVAAGPPSSAPPEAVAISRGGNTGPQAEAPQGHDPTLKWCIPDLRGKRESALPSAPQPPAGKPVLNRGEAARRQVSSLPDALAEGAITGALPQAIQESALDTSSPRAESFEILLADGSADAGEAQPLETPEENAAVTPPPVREALAVTPPPRREMEAVTPPPVREALAVTPPP